MKYRELDKILRNNGAERIVEMKSLQPIKIEDTTIASNKLLPYEKLVESKYLNKQVNGDLTLFNYSDKCTYDKHWNEHTMASRGLIINNVTGEVIARPLKKFFNLGELESPLLPNVPVSEKYDVYEKLDGSLAILFKDPSDDQWKLATRGSFKSDQAIKATEIFNNVPTLEFASHCERWQSMSGWHDYTLCFEVIYPENRMNDGARLVCDYGSKETLILLAAINKVTGKDLDYGNLTLIAKGLGLPIAKKYDYTIDDLIKLKETLPMTEEGWVVRFESGFRMKIKGDEYCKMQKILNSVTPLHIWELMSTTETFEVPVTYKTSIPEEILDEVEIIEHKLWVIKARISDEITAEYISALNYAKINYPDHLEKGLGMYTKDKSDLKHKSALFLYHKQNFISLNKYTNMYIRPTANQIGE